MTKTLPALTRRPAGMKPAWQKAMTAAALNAGLTADRVRGHIDPEKEDDAGVAAFFEARQGVKAEWLWWCLETHETEAAMSASLGAELEAVQKEEAAAAEEKAAYERSAQEERERVLAEVKENRKNALDILVERYVFSTHRVEFYDRRARSWISPQALEIAESCWMPLDEKFRRMSPLALWKGDQEGVRVHNERYMPGVAEEIVERDGVKWLNTWKPSGVKPKAGECKSALDLILHLCNGNKEHAGHLTDWMSYQVQNPGKKILHAPLIISKVHGVGKDTLYLLMEKVLGADNCTQPEDDAIAEGRHHYMKSAQLVSVGEVMCGDRRDVANKLKTLITQPRIEINEKHVKPYTVENQANFLLFSNFEDAAYIEDNDRRYYVIICNQGKMDAAVYDDLYDNYLRGPKIAHFAHMLMTRDLSKFNPAAAAPMTEHKATVQQATRSNADHWLEDAWESRAEPFDRDVVNLRVCLNVIANFRGAPKISQKQLSAFLRRVGGGDLGKPRIGDDGDQVRVWSVRDFEEVKAIDNNALRLCYQNGGRWQRAVTMASNKAA